MIRASQRVEIPLRSLITRWSLRRQLSFLQVTIRGRVVAELLDVRSQMTGLESSTAECSRLGRIPVIFITVHGTVSGSPSRDQGGALSFLSEALREEMLSTVRADRCIGMNAAHKSVCQLAQLSAPRVADITRTGVLEACAAASRARSLPVISASAGARVEFQSRHIIEKLQAAACPTRSHGDHHKDSHLTRDAVA